MGELILGKIKKEKALECTFAKFADGTELGGTVYMLEGKAVIQRDLDLLKERYKRNLIKFNKDKCKFQHIRRRSPLQ